MRRGVVTGSQRTTSPAVDNGVWGWRQHARAVGHAVREAVRADHVVR